MVEILHPFSKIEVTARGHVVRKAVRKSPNPNRDGRQFGHDPMPSMPPASLSGPRKNASPAHRRSDTVSLPQHFLAFESASAAGLHH